MLTDARLFDLWSRESYTGYTEAHKAFARAVEREARREALEEAAKVCETLKGFRLNECEHFAAAIYALKDKL